MTLFIWSIFVIGIVVFYKKLELIQIDKKEELKNAREFIMSQDEKDLDIAVHEILNKDI